MFNIAIIPARGGSKRIPRKNIKLFHGKPIIAYSIEVAKKSGLFDEVVVSTDDEEIANIAKQYGAIVPFVRPKKLSDDYTGTNDVIIHAINEMEHQGYHLDYVCCLYATSPLLQSHYLLSAYQKLSENRDKKFAFSVNKFSYPVQRSFTIEEGEVTPINPSALPKRSQDLPDVYHDAGQFYLATAKSFLSGEGGVFSKSSIPVILPSFLVQDIDDEDDWKRAELLFQVLLNQNFLENPK